MSLHEMASMVSKEMKPCYYMEKYYHPPYESKPKLAIECLSIRRTFPDVKFYCKRTTDIIPEKDRWDENTNKTIGVHLLLYKYDLSLYIFKMQYGHMTKQDKEKKINFRWVINGWLYGYPIREIQKSHDKNVEKFGDDFLKIH